MRVSLITPTELCFLTASMTSPSLGLFQSEHVAAAHLFPTADLVARKLHYGCLLTFTISNLLFVISNRSGMAGSYRMLFAFHSKTSSTRTVDSLHPLLLPPAIHSKLRLKSITHVNALQSQEDMSEESGPDEWMPTEGEVLGRESASGAGVKPARQGKFRGKPPSLAVGDRVFIRGNKRTPQNFVGRLAIITTQCLNGW